MIQVNLEYNTIAEQRTVHTLSTISDIVDEPNELNKNLSVVPLELILSFLKCISWSMKTNLYTYYIHQLHMESKIKVKGLLSDPLTFI